ncbi:MAG TPA: adenosine kinase [Spirochaetota bacterium]|nr:adenosine kinase [Spirochaetota bacterium]
MIDVVGIGSALVDLTIRVDDETLERLGLKKATMRLVDADRSRSILEALAGCPMEKTPGGSAANTAAGVATLGGSAVFMGKVGGDEFGDFYRDESERMGIAMRLARHRAMTGHAITLITPDSERTFATHLGAAVHFASDDVIEDEIRAARALHVEGYMLEGSMKEATLHAMEIARGGGVKVSIDLADSSLVGRNLDEFKSIARDYAGILYANEDEAAAFTGERGEKALGVMASMCEIAVVKLGERGSLIRKGTEVHRVEPYRVAVVNTNGAGDMYAAGMLYGLSRGLSLDKAGRIASYAASRVVSQVGARLSSRPDLGQIGI